MIARTNEGKIDYKKNYYRKWTISCIILYAYCNNNKRTYFFKYKKL